MEGASGPRKVGFDETGQKRILGYPSRRKSAWVLIEVPVAYSPRLRNADNAELGLAIAALVENTATVGWRRVNVAATQGRRCRQRLSGAVSTLSHCLAETQQWSQR